MKGLTMALCALAVLASLAGCNRLRGAAEPGRYQPHQVFSPSGPCTAPDGGPVIAPPEPLLDCCD